jgi:ribose-phosphate pyrophosphokinase
MLKLFAGNTEIEINFWSFPGGERGVKLLNFSSNVPMEVSIQLDFKNSNDLIDLLLLVDCVKSNMNFSKLTLNIPYFPYARQDRLNSGESFSLRVIANLIKSCGFDKVVVVDPHSDVLAGMFPSGMLEIVTQEEVLVELIKNKGYKKFALIAPDAGASKKTQKIAMKLGGVSVIQANKIRNMETGKISGTAIDSSEFGWYDNLIVCDDIIDGGATFIELGKIIRKEYSGGLHLVATHGIFSKGITVFDGIFDSVEVYNDMRGI